MAHEIRVLKSAALLQHFLDGKLLGEYPAQVGRNAADKVREGDEATPLGEFFVCAKNPRSRFRRSLCLSYPNRWHAERGRREGLIDQAQFEAIVQSLETGRMPPQHTPLGGEIYLHGSSNQTPGGTRGCVAVDDTVIDALFEAVPLGSRVSILP